MFVICATLLVSLVLGAKDRVHIVTSSGCTTRVARWLTLASLATLRGSELHQAHRNNHTGTLHERGRVGLEDTLGAAPQVLVNTKMTCRFGIGRYQCNE